MLCRWKPRESLVRVAHGIWSEVVNVNTDITTNTTATAAAAAAAAADDDDDDDDDDDSVTVTPNACTLRLNSFQVLNYGIGGHFVTHMDTTDVSAV